MKPLNPTSAEANGHARGRRETGQCADRFWWLLLALTGAAIGVRLLAVLITPQPFLFPFGGDGYYYYLSAISLAGGEGFVNGMVPRHPPHALHPPLWTSLLGLAAWFGWDSPLEQQIVASVIGAGTVALLGSTARLMISARVGIVAAAIAALYPGLWLYERNLNAETLMYPLIAGLAMVVYPFRARPTLGGGALLGLLVGLLAMTRSEQILVAPLLLVPLILARRELGWLRRMAELVLCGAVVLLVITPWTLYNLGRFEHPVILSAGAGNAMAPGACDETFYGARLGGYDVEKCSRPVPGWGERDNTVRDAKLRAAAIAYTKRNLSRLPVVVLARVGRSWGVFDPTAQVERDIMALNAPHAVIWMQLVSYWLLLPFAFVGIFAFRRLHVPVYPLLTFPAIVVISTAMTFGDSRYRAAAEPSIVLLAAAGIDALLRLRWNARHADPLRRPTSTWTTGGRKP